MATDRFEVQGPGNLRDRLDAAAAKAGTTRNALAVAILDRALGGGKGPHRPTGCEHPAAKRKVLGYATFCDEAKGGCGERIR